MTILVQIYVDVSKSVCFDITYVNLTRKVFLEKIVWFGGQQVVPITIYLEYFKKQVFYVFREK